MKETIYCQEQMDSFPRGSRIRYLSILFSGFPSSTSGSFYQKTINGDWIMVDSFSQMFGSGRIRSYTSDGFATSFGSSILVVLPE